MLTTPSVTKQPDDTGLWPVQGAPHTRKPRCLQNRTHQARAAGPCHEVAEIQKRTHRFLQNSSANGAAESHRAHQQVSIRLLSSAAPCVQMHPNASWRTASKNPEQTHA